MRRVSRSVVSLAAAVSLLNVAVPSAQAPATAINLNETSIDELQEARRARRVTCRTVVDHISPPDTDAYENVSAFSLKIGSREESVGLPSTRLATYSPSTMPCLYP
jgi:hypothetical protein